MVAKGTEHRAIALKFGFFGLKSLSNGRISSKNIEIAYKAINRRIKPFGKMWVRVFAFEPVSSIPSKVRMGKGKGSVSYWGGCVKKGQILYEVSGIPKEQAIKALRLGSLKLPFKTKIVCH